MRRHSIFLIAIVLVFAISPSTFAGMIMAWGDNWYGQVEDIPLGDDFVDISTAYWGHGLAQKSDGSLVSRGRSDVNEVPTGNDFVAISAGSYYNLALRSDGSLAAAGQDSKITTEMRGVNGKTNNNFSLRQANFG